MYNSQKNKMPTVLGTVRTYNITVNHPSNYAKALSVLFSDAHAHKVNPGMKDANM